MDFFESPTNNFKNHTLGGYTIPYFHALNGYPAVKKIASAAIF
jgi:hypothetical protein